MNSDRLEGNWKELKGKAQRKWGMFNKVRRL